MREQKLTDYEAQLEESQKNLKLRPVVWNKGRTIGAVPLSKLALRIGQDDISDDDEPEMTKPDKVALAGNM
jgi:hypothetical protein